jgi:heptosyltransferase-2
VRGTRPVLAVRLPNWLGDAVLAARAVDGLFARFPEHDLVLVARPWAPALFAAHWPAARWHAAPGSGLRWLPAVPSLARLGAGTIVLLPPSLSARLHAACAGIPQRLGLAHEEGDFLLTRTAPRGPRGSRPLEEEYLDLVRGLGAEPPPRRPLVVPAGAADGAERALAAAGADPDRVRSGPRLVLAPGARYGPSKRWPAERFAATAEAWVQASGAPGAAHVLLVGGAEDAAEVAAVRAASSPGPARVVALAGHTDLPALAGLLASADAVLANDSGVAHLAAALGRPTAVVFGSTDPRWTAPRGPAVRVLVDPPSCAPCFRPACAVPERYRCLRAIAPEDAARALAAAQAAARRLPAEGAEAR